MTRMTCRLGGLALLAFVSAHFLATSAKAIDPAAPSAPEARDLAERLRHPAPAGRYTTDPAHTSVTWDLDHLGLSRWTARFVDVRAGLDWRPDRPETSSLVVEIPAHGLRTDFPWPEEKDFDAFLAEEPDFLGGQPIRFVSERIEVTGPATGLVHGRLTLRGDTRPMTLDVTFNGSMEDHPISGEPKIGFSATGRLNRSDWGMDVLLPQIGDEVRIAIETQLVPETH